MKYNLQQIVHQFSARLFKNGALKVAFFTALLFWGVSLLALPSEHPASTPRPAGNNVCSGLLTVNRDCEAPTMRCRFGQQLQMNFRSARTGQLWSLQRNNHLTGKLLPDLCRPVIQPISSPDEALRENSTYLVYSPDSLPVRAGPLFSTTEQSSFA